MRLILTLVFIATLVLVFTTDAVVEQGHAGEFTKSGLNKRKTELTGLLGQRRVYRYYVPTRYDSERSYPLVIALHGINSRGRNIRLRSGLDDVAERDGFIAVYPEGNGIGALFKHWNAGACCAKAMKKGIDDAGFVMRIVDELSTGLSIDASRIYLFGFSNGAMLTYQIAAKYPERIAAIAAVSGTFGRVTASGELDWYLPRPAMSVPTLIVHGSDDPRLPFNGVLDTEKRDGLGMIPVKQSANFWARVNDCPTQPTTPSSGYENVDLMLWSKCESTSEVRLYRLSGWEHSWAGASSKTRSDYNKVGGFETAEVIWEFFQRFSRSKIFQ